MTDSKAHQGTRSRERALERMPERAPERAPERPIDAVSSSAGLESVVCFVVDGKSYALDVTVVRQVVSIEKVLPVPRTAPAIIGVFALHGATMALVDTRIIFGLPPAPTATTALVVARGHRTICGITIDRVIGVARFSETSFTPAVRGREPPQIAGFMADERGALVTVLDTSILVHALEALRF
jgi:purine-binding chemotaxis protein CheW